MSRPLNVVQTEQLYCELMLEARVLENGGDPTLAYMDYLERVFQLRIKEALGFIDTFIAKGPLKIYKDKPPNLYWIDQQVISKFITVTLVHYGYGSTTQNPLPTKSIFSATHCPPHSWPTNIKRYLYPQLFIHHGYGSTMQNPLPAKSICLDTHC